MASKGIVINISGSGEGAAEALRQIEARMRETSEHGKEAGVQLEAAWRKVETVLGAIGIGVGFGEVIAKIKEAVQAAGEFGESISKASERTGIAAGTLSVLHYAAAITGSDFDQLVGGVSKLGKNMGEAADGNKKLAGAFAGAGIDAASLAGKNNGLELAFQKLGKTLVATEAPARRNQLIMELLGKAGSSSISVIRDLALHFDELKQKTIDAGRYLDELHAEKLKLLNQALKDIQERVSGAQVAFAEGLAPALQGIVSSFSDASKGSDFWTEAGKQSGLVAIEVAAAFKWLANFVRETKDEYLNLNAAITAADASAGAALNWTKKLRDEEAAKRDAALKVMHDTKLDHEAAEAEEKRFIDAMKKLKDQIISGKTESFGSSSLHTGDGSGFKGAGASDGITALDRDFWLSDPNSVLNAYRKNQKIIYDGIRSAMKTQADVEKQDIADNVQFQKDLVEKARKELSEDSPNVSVFGGAASIAFDPDAYKREAQAAEVQRRIQQQIDEDASAPNKKSDIANQVGQDAARAVDQLTQSALRGRLSFRQLADSVITDLERIVMKMAVEGPIIRAFMSLVNSFGGGAAASTGGYAETQYSGIFAGTDHFANGGDINSGWAVVGDGGDGSGSELFAPKGPGTVLPHDVLKGIAEGGKSGGGAPNVQVNVVNNSSAQVQKNVQTNYDAAAKQFVVHAVLEDMNSGGPLAGAMSGFAPR
jgi:hypothetical protein